MATFAEIKAVRLKIADPPDFIDIVSVATTANLPLVTAPQTVYKVLADDSYMYTENLIHAIPLDYIRCDVLFSDDFIGNIIDNYPNNIMTKLLRFALIKITNKMEIIRNSTGVEDIQFVSLNERLNAYKKLLQDYEDEEKADSGNNVGQYLRTENPTICGGDI